MNEKVMNFSNEPNGLVSHQKGMLVCPKCHTSVDEIMQTGFVGCEKCYELPEIKAAVERMYEGKRHQQDGRFE